MAETPERLPQGLALVGSTQAEVDTQHSAERTQHEEKNAAFDPHVMEKIAISIGAQLFR